MTIKVSLKKSPTRSLHSPERDLIHRSLGTSLMRWHAKPPRLDLKQTVILQEIKPSISTQNTRDQLSGLDRSWNCNPPPPKMAAKIWVNKNSLKHVQNKTLQIFVQAIFWVFVWIAKNISLKISTITSTIWVAVVVYFNQQTGAPHAVCWSK